MKQHFDIHQHITDRIVAAIEAGVGEWRMPWHRGSGGRHPVNIASGKAYRGVNVLALWVEAQTNGFSSHLWGTYRQWAEKQCQVRKGCKASYVIFCKEIEVASDEGEETAPETRLLARATPVFNADQVEGWHPEPLADAVSPVESAERFVAQTGAKVLSGGSRACYVPSLDEIHMPGRQAFVGSATSSAGEAYYSTLFHELTHWTGPKHRCDRDLSGRFGSDAYAMEELIAELGAAFLCGELGIAVEPRPDHAQYLAHWLAVLKADKRAIFAAASKAGQAVEFLRGGAG